MLKFAIRLTELVALQVRLVSKYRNIDGKLSVRVTDDNVVRHLQMLFGFSFS